MCAPQALKRCGAENGASGWYGHTRTCKANGQRSPPLNTDANLSLSCAGFKPQRSVELRSGDILLAYIQPRMERCEPFLCISLCQIKHPQEACIPGSNLSAMKRLNRHYGIPKKANNLSIKMRIREQFKVIRVARNLRQE